jgi:hypothetical protein
VKWLKPMTTREQEKLRGIREATARKYLGIPHVIMDAGPTLSTALFILPDIDEQWIWSELIEEHSQLKKRELTGEERKLVEEYVVKMKSHGMRVLTPEPGLRLELFKNSSKGFFL